MHIMDACVHIYECVRVRVLQLQISSASALNNWIKMKVNQNSTAVQIHTEYVYF